MQSGLWVSQHQTRSHQKLLHDSHSYVCARFVTHPKDVLHLKASFFQPLDGHQLRQWNITDWPLALSLAVAQRVRRQAKVALLKITSTEAFPILSMFRHHPA
jgi:hypothetical protein